jgi:hypothetical protein
MTTAIEKNRCQLSVIDQASFEEPTKTLHRGKSSEVVSIHSTIQKIQLLVMGLDNTQPKLWLYFTEYGVRSE